MRKRYALLLSGIFGMAGLSGCYTTTVDKGPPKMGQTVERPNPAANQMAETHANQVQQDTSTSSTVIPGESNEPIPARGNSIFSNGVVSNPSTSGATMEVAPANANTNGTVRVDPGVPGNNGAQSAASAPESSPLAPTNSNAGTKDGGG